MIMFLRSTCAIVCIGFLFLFMTVCYSIVCIYHMLVRAAGSVPAIEHDSESVLDQYFSE